jgi:hypothetical protein
MSWGEMFVEYNFNLHLLTSLYIPSLFTLRVKRQYGEKGHTMKTYGGMDI